MSGNKRGPAAAFAGGMIALAVLAGCASAPGPGQSAVASQEAHEHEHEEAASGQDHTGHSAMDHSGMDHSGMQHGQSPAAPEAVAPGQPAATLQPGPLDAPAATSVLDAQRSAQMAEEMAGGGHEGHGGHEDHGAHGVAGYRHVDAGRGPGAYEGSEEQIPGAGSHQHEGEHSHESHGPAESEEATVYVCPMHPEVTSDAPGKCPKCGMALVERRKG